MPTLSQAQLQKLNQTQKAVAGRDYIVADGPEAGALYRGQRNGTLLFITANFNKKAITAVGEALTNSGNIDQDFDSEDLEISSNLTETGVAAGTYGDATNVVQLTCDTYGRILSVVEIPVSADFITAIADTATIDLNVTTGTLTANFIGDTDDVPEGIINFYFTTGRVLATTLTGYVSGAGVISSADTILSAIQKLNGNISALTTGVSSVFGRTGAVVAVSGDYNTSLVTELTNLYFTTARVLATALSGLSLATSQVIASTDTTLQAFGYLQAQTTAIRASGIGVTLSGSGGVVSTGSKGYVTLPFGITLTSFYIVGNVSGSCVVDLRVSGVSIVGAGNKPTLSGAQRANAALSGWTTTALAANTEIEWYVDSCSTISQIDLTIKGTKAI